jgi:menaquinone-dependent protoporphyrinogen IX oxidase/uncharacterized protein YhbP (UPF0306 family)
MFIVIRTLIVYESKYGFTEKISKDLAMVLGPANICRTNEFKSVYKEFDLFVICTPIYSEKSNQDIVSFVKNNSEWLQYKKVILLCSCLVAKGYEKYLKELNNMLGDSVIFQGTIGGVLDLNKLNSDDYEKMQKFSNQVGLPFMSYDSFNKSEFVDLALKIKELKDDNIKLFMEREELKKHIDEFLKSHNTCSLCTGHEDSIRSTPIEYSYINDMLYMISEGGEKFANLLINDSVSISIYDPFKAMNQLGGMQIDGRASVVDLNSNEYMEVLEKRGLKYNQLINLPIRMNVIKVSVKKIEFLWSNFKELRYEAKQIYRL